MGEIADLFATLGLKVNLGQWAQGTAQIKQTQGALGRLTPGAHQAQVAFNQLATGATTLSRMLGGVAPAANQAGSAAVSSGKQAARSWDAAGAALKGWLVYLGASFGYEKLIKFNSTVEDSKNQIAGMLALTRKTNLSDELGNANMLMADLQQRAAKLPGTTAEYVSMLSNITRPIIDAKLSMKDLEDITVGAVVAAKALGVDAGASARDIDQALRGQYHSVDQFTGKLLGSVGYEGEEGRAKFNALSKAQRASELKRAINQPQIQQLAEAQGKTFSGVLSTLQDSLEQFFGKVGGALFGRLKGAIEQVNAWLDANQEKIQQIAAVVGDALASAFEFLGEAVGFVIEKGGPIIDWISQFIDGSELLKSALAAIGVVLAVFAVQSAIAFATNPIFLTIAAITALVYGIRWMLQHPEKVKKAFRDAFDAIVNAAKAVWEAIKTGFSYVFDALAYAPGIAQLIWLVKKIEALRNLWGESTKNERTLEDSNKMSSEEFRKNHPEIDTDNEATRNLYRLQHGQAPILTTPAASSSTMTTNIGTVAVGDINVHSPNADPVAVGDQVRKMFHEELGNTIRKATDVYG